MDQALLGDATVKLMESIEREGKFEDGKIIAVGVIAIIEQPDDDGAGMTYIRTYSTEEIHHRALGLFREAYLTIEQGHEAEPDPEDE
jgi:hypothetical protein